MRLEDVRGGGGEEGEPGLGQLRGHHFSGDGTDVFVFAQDLFDAGVAIPGDGGGVAGEGEAVYFRIFPRDSAGKSPFQATKMAVDEQLYLFQRVTNFVLPPRSKA